MPRGDKSKYTDKQKRQAEHIEEGYEQRGVPQEEAERRAWATVNKMTGGGKRVDQGGDIRSIRRPQREAARGWCATARLEGGPLGKRAGVGPKKR